MTVASSDAPDHTTKLTVTGYGLTSTRGEPYEHNLKAMRYLIETMKMDRLPTCSKDCAVMHGYEVDDRLGISYHNVLFSVFSRKDNPLVKLYVGWAGDLKRYFAIPFMSGYRAYVIGLHSFYASSREEAEQIARINAAGVEQTLEANNNAGLAVYGGMHQ